MKKLEKNLTQVLEIVMSICLLAITTIVVALVIMRYLFNTSITGANEWITILFVYSTAIGAAVVLGKREHIAIPFAVESLPLRGQKVVESIALVLILILNTLMVYYSIHWIMVTGNYLMPATGLPRIVAQMSVPLGCSIAIFYCFLKLLQLPSATEDYFGPPATSKQDSRSAE